MKAILAPLIISLFLYTSLTGCIKEKPCHHETYFDDYAKNLFFSYGIGSYWVYEDSLGNIDSTWVSDIADGPISPTCKESLECDLSSSDPNYNLSIYGQAGSPSGVRIDIRDEYCFSLSFLDRALNTIQYQGISYTLLPNYQVNQFTFSNAVKFISTECINIHYIVVVPNIGIVEKTGKYGPPFKLIKYSLK
ncbi:MAG TPA: hypothetical protein VG603_14620 [Chitinophagales bacterium]|nr:hypothetical protein [Chitinophagales bacterium]